MGLILTLRHENGVSRAIMHVAEDGGITKSGGLSRRHPPTRLIGFSVAGDDIGVSVQQALTDDAAGVVGMIPVIDDGRGIRSLTFTVATIRTGILAADSDRAAG